MKRFAATLTLTGVIILAFGTHWGHRQNYLWRGTFEYDPRRLDIEYPRPFSRVFDNYVIDQWPLVIGLGLVLTIFGAGLLISRWRARRLKS